MTRHMSRRALLAGAASVAATGASARAPDVAERPLARGTTPVVELPSSEVLVRKAALGGAVGFAVVDISTGEVLEERLGETLLPPASTLKAVTAIYAMERLGADFRFRTEIRSTARIVGGVLDGDLLLVGGGDPTLDTDRLAEIAIGLREAGLREVRGRLVVAPGPLPRDDRIDPDQPEQVSYNPAYGGLNLNYNRVHFEWQRRGDAYDVTMEARAARFSPATNVAQMSIVERRSPVFDYWTTREKDIWSVSRAALGSGGARWLPVRYPALYAGDVFRTLARSNGIVLGAPVRAESVEDGKVLAASASDPLAPVLTGMLKYSTNLTAEMVGLKASVSNGVPVANLLASGSRMAGWVMERHGATGVRFRDHSGLGYGSALAPNAMTRILADNFEIAPMLKSVNLSLDKRRGHPDGVSVRAKTGTLNFVSALAGYLTAASGRQMAFAIFTADTARRDAIPPEQRENPRGARGWASRSRQLQKELLLNWAQKFDAA